MDFPARVFGSGRILSFYFARVFLPIDYLPTYSWPTVSRSLIAFLPWVVLAGGLYFLWTKRRSWGRHALLGFGFFLLILAPFLGFVKSGYMDFTWVMDHFLYIPIIGLIGLGVAALGDLRERFPQYGAVVTGVATIVLALMAIESHAFANLFSSDETLWTYALQREPDSWIVQANFAADLMKRKQYEEAIARYQLALRLNPAYGDGYYNLGAALEKIGQTAAAQDAYRQAAKVNPSDGMVYINLAESLLKTGHKAEAMVVYRQAD